MTDSEGFEGPTRPLKLYYLGRGEDWGFLFQEQKTGGPIRREGLIVLLGILTGDLDFCGFWCKAQIPQCSSLEVVPPPVGATWSGCLPGLGTHPLDLGSWGWFPKLGRLTAQSQFKLPSLQVAVEPPANMQYKERAPDRDTSEWKQRPGSL